MSKTITISSWDGSIVPDKRTASPSSSVLSQRFETHTKPHALVPYRDMQSDYTVEATADTSRITRMLYDGTYWWGLGVVNGSTDSHVQLYRKSEITGSWSTIGAATSSSGGTTTGTTFIYYASQDTIYGDNATGIFSYDIGGGTFTYNENTSVTPSGQGIVHSKDDVLYIPCGSVIASKNGSGSWSNDAFTGLPSDFSSVSVAEYGDYLIIAGNRAGVGGVVYFWDRNSSVGLATEKYLFDDLAIAWCDDIGGVPVVLGTRTDPITLHMSFVFFAIEGSTPRELFTFRSGVFASTPSDKRQKHDNSLDFLMEAQIDGTFLPGIWRITRQADGTFTLTFVMPPRNDATYADTGHLKAFYRHSGYYFISYIIDDSSDETYTLWRTSSTDTYSGTAIRQTVVNPGIDAADRFALKAVKSVALYFEAIGSGLSVELDYRVDAGSWTTLISDATQDDIYAVAFNDTTGNAIKSGREYEFRIKSNGVTVTGLSYKYELAKSDL